MDQARDLVVAVVIVAVIAVALCQPDEATGGNRNCSVVSPLHQPFDFSPFVWAKIRCCCSGDQTVLYLID